jgi:hypothetical protein
MSGGAGRPIVPIRKDLCMAATAGWYPDPKDSDASERYWDGAAWTAQLRPAPSGSTGGPKAGWHIDPKDADLERFWDGAAWTHRTRPRFAEPIRRSAPTSTAPDEVERTPADRSAPWVPRAETVGANDADSLASSLLSVHERSDADDGVFGSPSAHTEIETTTVRDAQHGRHTRQRRRLPVLIGLGVLIVVAGVGAYVVIDKVKIHHPGASAAVTTTSTTLPKLERFCTTANEFFTAQSQGPPDASAALEALSAMAPLAPTTVVVEVRSVDTGLSPLLQAQSQPGYTFSANKAAWVQGIDTYASAQFKGLQSWVQSNCASTSGTGQT